MEHEQAGAAGGRAMDDTVDLCRARSLVHRVWAQNHHRGVGDAVADVRGARQADVDTEVAEWPLLGDPEETPRAAAARLAAALSQSSPRYPGIPGR